MAKIKLDFSPRIFLRDKTHTYLLVREGNKYGYFLHWEDGIIDIKKVPFEEGEYRVHKLNEGEVPDKLGEKAPKYIYHVLRPYREQNFMAAVQRFWDSHIEKTPRAEREIRVILGLPAIQVPEDEDEPGKSRERAPRAPKKPAEGFSLASICEELKVDPSRARKFLRDQKTQKPSGGWTWASRDAAHDVIKLLNENKSNL